MTDPLRALEVPRHLPQIMHDESGVTVFLADDRLCIEECDPEPRASDVRVDSAWAAMCGRNARLFDGPILAVRHFDADRQHVLVERSSFKWLAVQAECGVETRTEQLGVTGVITRCGSDGVDRVLLGRRGDQTRIYASSWELGPSGGVDPPAQPPYTSARPADQRFITREIVSQLADEMTEEFGVVGTLSDVRVIALCRDPNANNIDVVIHARWEDARSTPIDNDDHPWEYSDRRWASAQDLGRWDHSADPMIAPTRALLRWLGWMA